MGKLEIYERAISIGSYIVENKATVRQAANQFGINKSTVHHDMRAILPQCDGELTKLVAEVLEENKSLRHIRGGLATKRKFSKI